MFFNSIDFAIFLPIVFFLYWFVVGENLKLQNTLIVIASYVFYGWWDWRFLSLIFFSTIIDYFIGTKLNNEENESKRKFMLLLSVFINIGFLGFFKYSNFFLDNFITAFSFFGTKIESNTLNIILPVGISFYTFQTLSYTIDVYKRKLKPTGDFIAFSAFVSFFPQLVAGPIEKAVDLLPQFYKKRTFEYDKGVDGLRQILWGLFKKIVIADNCAQIVNEIFNNSLHYTGSALAIGAVFFSFQIYGDFSGYSDIAIGTARLFGFSLKQNFAFPYFSKNIAEFWRKWHISLMIWFKDYVYIPLGGSRGTKYRTIINTLTVFFLSGLWHGANWTFIIWGLLNAFYLFPIIIFQKKNKINGKIVNNKYLLVLVNTLKIVITFSLTTLTWIVFRADSVSHAISYMTRIFSRSIIEFPMVNISKVYAIHVSIMIMLLALSLRCSTIFSRY